MISVEFLEQKNISDDINSFEFEIRALPDPDQRGQFICGKLADGLLERYGANEMFAVEVNIIGSNATRQTLIIETIIKGENLTPTSLAEFITNNVRIAD